MIEWLNRDPQQAPDVTGFTKKTAGPEHTMTYNPPSAPALLLLAGRFGKLVNYGNPGSDKGERRVFLDWTTQERGLGVYSRAV